jgi:formate C-acetyltransferase
VVRRAKALKRVIEEKKIVILPDELIVGTRGSQPRAAEICPEISWMWVRDELDTISTRPQDPYSITEEQKRILREEVFPYWKGKSMQEYYLANLDEETKRIAYKTGIIFSDSKSLYGPGEINPGYGNIILKKGFRGIKERAEQKLKEMDYADISNFDKRKFWEAVIICCKAMKLLGQRYADKAREMAEKENLKRKEELLRIAEMCEWVPWNSPRTFWEALQAIELTQIALWTEENCSSICPGRMDQYLYALYEKDLEEGKLTKAETQELIECMWIKMAEMIFTIDADSAMYFAGYQPFQGVTVGGLKRDKQDATNELSYMMVQASMDVRLHAPSLNVRIHPQTPDDFLLKTCDLVNLGTGQPAIFFDPTALRILLRLGVKIEDAYDWCVAGCVEPNVPGKMSRWAEGNRYSYATAVEWALYDGMSHVLQKRKGLSTGDPRSFKTYEDFKEAVKRQLAYLIRYSAIDTQTVEKAHQTRLPKPLMSCCVEDCVEDGVEIMHGGAHYNLGPGFETTGIADLADSMAAVKKLVFEEKLLTTDELITALQNNFEGYENIRQMLINKAPKYGNDIDEVDLIAAEMLDFAVEETEKYKGIKGSVFRDGLVPVIANVPHGKAIWALPSGRKAMQPLADGISPYMGYDHNGPTAVLKSVCKINHDKHFATLLNLKFSPEVLKDEKGKRNLANLLRTEMELGGYHVQFNVVSVEVLRDAQHHPEKYPDLLVRVAGYSARFVDLSKEMQDVIIERTEHMTW